MASQCYGAFERWWVQHSLFIDEKWRPGEGVAFAPGHGGSSVQSWEEARAANTLPMFFLKSQLWAFSLSLGCPPLQTSV